MINELTPIWEIKLAEYNLYFTYFSHQYKQPCHCTYYSALSYIEYEMQFTEGLY